MNTTSATGNPLLKDMVDRLVETVGTNLRSVLLYGSAARGDYQKATSDFNLLLVLERLDPASLEALTPVITRWVRRGQPFPRLFSPQLIRDAADVFPIEFHDIRSCHAVLHGEDLFDGLSIQGEHLRIQCERELREKLMRLREGYVEANTKPRAIRRLLTDSYTTFVALFRGCLRLLGGDVPLHNADVVSAFCEVAGLDRGPFDDVDRLKRGETVTAEPKEIFTRYYEELTKAVGKVDRFVSGGREGVNR